MTQPLNLTFVLYLHSFSVAHAQSIKVTNLPCLPLFERKYSLQMLTMVFLDGDVKRYLDFAFPPICI